MMDKLMKLLGVSPTEVVEPEIAIYCRDDGNCGDIPTEITCMGKCFESGCCYN